MEKSRSLRLDRARWWALREQTFYGQLAMGLVDKESQLVPVCATDGKAIFWNCAKLDKLSEEELRWALLKQALHCAHLHSWRLNPDDPTAQVACNHIVYEILSNVPGCKHLKGTQACPAKYRHGWAEEEVYKDLIKNGGASPDDPAIAAAGVFLAPSGAKDDHDKLRDEWTRRVIQAVQASRMHGCGNVPVWADELLERVLAPRIDWRQEMADFVKECVLSRNDWSRSARRHAWQKVVYPKKHQDDTGLVVFARDCSGSISNETCAVFTALITDCLGETKCRGIVLDHDTEIAQETWLEAGDECPLIRPACGGTSHVDIAQRVEQLKEDGERVAGVVALTDLDTCFPSDSNGTAWLWLATEDREAPFGRIVRVEE